MATIKVTTNLQDDQTANQLSYAGGIKTTSLAGVGEIFVGADNTGLLKTKSLNVLYYEATIGTGGDYATVQLAISAGKKKLLFVSNVTETSNVTTGSGTKDINLAGFTWAMGAYSFPGSGGSDRLYIHDGALTFGYSGSGNALFGNNWDANNYKSLWCYRLTITNTSTGSDNTITYAFGTFTDCIINLPNIPMGGFSRGTSWNYICLTNIQMIGGGSSCYYAIWSLGTTSMGYMNNIEFLGTYSNAAPIAFLFNFNNITFTTASTCSVYAYNGTNLFDYKTSPTVTLTLGDNIDNFRLKTLSTYSVGKVSNGSFIAGGTHSITTNSNILNEVSFDNAVIISGDYNKLSDCSITGLLTLNVGSEYNVIQGNTLSGGLTDSSASTTNIIKDNIG